MCSTLPMRARVIYAMSQSALRLTVMDDMEKTVEPGLRTTRLRRPQQRRAQHRLPCRAARRGRCRLQRRAA